MTKSLNRNPIRALTGAALGFAIWYGGYGGVRGNDTGGIIPWSPGIDHSARQMAAGHCGSYGKYALITSVHPWYGDYIGFVCRRPVRWGPVLQ
jgi:hypothetical protein